MYIQGERKNSQFSHVNENSELLSAHPVYLFRLSTIVHHPLTTEQLNVLAHPLDGQHLIVEPGVRHVLLVPMFEVVVEEAEQSYAIVGRHKDHLAEGGEEGAVVRLHADAHVAEAAAVQVDHHRK